MHSLPILKTSAKSVQTTAEVCADYSWSLQKVLRTYEFKYAHLPKCLRVLTDVSTRTYENKYDVITKKKGCTEFCIQYSQKKFKRA